jgi:FkbM family methyltransferase
MRRNLLANLLQSHGMWRSLQKFPGAFAARDAALQFNRVILPQRFHHREAGVSLRKRTSITRVDDQLWKVEVTELGLHFYWPQEPDNNLWFAIEQELETHNPHYYTTPPIEVGSDSVVLDIGSCEGLFAFRLLSQRLAQRVIAFEPFPRMRELLRRGAVENRVGDRLGASIGKARFTTSAVSDGNSLAQSSQDAASIEVHVTTLDAFCTTSGLRMKPSDLIKIDVEGADFSVLEGAIQTIREYRPQIAVTTYHEVGHAEQMLSYLKQLVPEYRFRVKGFAFWMSPIRPVLLQASTLASGT